MLGENSGSPFQILQMEDSVGVISERSRPKDLFPVFLTLNDPSFAIQEESTKKPVREL